MLTHMVLPSDVNMRTVIMQPISWLDRITARSHKCNVNNDRKQKLFRKVASYPSPPQVSSPLVHAQEAVVDNSYDLI